MTIVEISNHKLKKTRYYNEHMYSKSQSDTFRHIHAHFGIFKHTDA